MGTTGNAQRYVVIAGLRQRIDWLLANDRPNEEITRVVEVIGTLLEKHVSEETAQTFYADLAREFPPSD